LSFRYGKTTECKRLYEQGDIFHLEQGKQNKTMDESRNEQRQIYLEENLVTPLVPSEIACLLSSPGKINLTAVWISREEMVDFLLYDASLEASEAVQDAMGWDE
jgi:hypothetical protein